MIALVPLHASHLPAVQRYAADPRIAASAQLPSPYPADGAEQWFAAIAPRRASGQSVVFAIEREGDFCGVMSLNAIDRERGGAQLDYWVAVPWQNQGVATEAAALAIRHAGEVLGLRRLHGTCLASNPASARVMQRQGFVEGAGAVMSTGRFRGQPLRRFSLLLQAPA